MTNIIPQNKKIEPLYSSAEESFNASRKSPTHPEHTSYLTKKGLSLEDVPEARYGNYYGTPSMAVPIKDIDGRIQSIQYIYQDKEGRIQKRFLQGGKKAGCFLALDNIEDGNTIFITEGYATAVSLKKILTESKDMQDAKVICAFSAQDLPKVAQALKERFGYSEIIAAPDSDEAGSKAAKECQSMGVYAVFPPQIRRGMDWNDLLQEMGLSGATDEFEKSMHLKTAASEPRQNIQAIPEQREAERISFPLDQLPPSMKAFALELQEKVQAAPEIVGGCLLSTASLLVQGLGNVKEGIQSIPLSIFTLMVAKTGERKTSTEKIVLKKIRQIERNDTNQYKTELEGYKVRKKLWEKELSKKQLSESEIEERLKTKPRPPIHPKILMGDPTTEGIFKQFGKGRDCLGLFADEGSKMFGGHSLSKDKQLSGVGHLSSLWDGSPIERTRVSEEEDVTLFDKRLAVCLMVQPYVFFPNVWDNQLMQEQGFLARFLISCPKELAGQRTYSLDNIKIENADEFEKRAFPGLYGLKVENIYLSPNARQRKLEMQQSIESELVEGGKYSLVKAFANKIVEQAIRIAAVLSLFEGMLEIERDNLNCWEISLEYFEKGRALAMWYLEEALRLMNLDIDEQEKKDEDKVLLVLEKRCKEFTSGVEVREVAIRCPNTMNRSAENVRLLLRKLQAQGKAESAEIDGREIWYPANE